MTNIQVLLKDNIVIAELVFEDNDPVVMQETFDKFNYDQVINPRWKQIPLGGVGSAWNGTSFVPQPFPSWTLDNTFHWQPPKPKPDGDYNWDETKSKWVFTDNSDKVSDCIDCDN